MVSYQNLLPYLSCKHHKTRDRLAYASHLGLRWGWGRKLIGADAKISAEIAISPPQKHNHPGARSPPPDGFTSGMLSRDSVGLHPTGFAVPLKQLHDPPAPRTVPGADSRQHRAFCSRTGSKTDPLLHPQPALIISAVALSPCRAPPFFWSRCKKYTECPFQGCGSICAAPWASYLSKSRFPGVLSPARASCWPVFGHLQSPCYFRHGCASLGNSSVRDCSFIGMVAQLLASPQATKPSLVPFPFYICFFYCWWCPSFNTK